MKFKALSDTHFDFYFNPDTHIKSKQLSAKMNHYFEHNEENLSLIIAGDLGHYPKQNIEIFKILKDEYNYKEIIVTFGNHDYYNVSKTQKLDFKTYQQKDDYLVKLYEDNEIIMLNGNKVYDIEGTKIFGYPSWYDDSLYRREFHNMYSRDIDHIWKNSMNDARLIPGLDSLFDMYKYQNNKLILPKERIDIMVSHVRPFVSTDYIDYRYINDVTNTFYMFDGRELMDKINPDIWIYGHSHSHKHYVKDNIEFICNPIGYPAEDTRFKNFILD